MRAPRFWQKGANPLLRSLLWPLSLVWRLGGALRRATSRPASASIPVVCVGNLEMGGTGKTPAVQLLARWFAERGVRAGVLSRGYGGSLSGRTALLVDPDIHTSTQVGDEPLLHARSGPVVISPDRSAGAELLTPHCDVILMDDGHQNTDLIKDLSIVVTRAAEAFGNGAVFPAGPLREPIGAGLARANAIMAIGGGIPDMRLAASGLPVIRGRLQANQRLDGEKLLAFCGIGRPDGFRETLEELGADLAGFESFADHHAFSQSDLAQLAARADRLNARLVTTEKDAVRLPPNYRTNVLTVPVTLGLDQPELLDRLLDPVLARVRTHSSGAGPTNRS